MKFCILVVHVMENIISYGPNLKIEIGGNDSHSKICKMLCFYHISTYCP